MRFFAKKTMLVMGLVATVTTIGVYHATAGSAAMSERPAMLHPESGLASVGMKGNRPIRTVGPSFFPDNGNVKLLGAAAERARRG